MYNYKSYERGEIAMIQNDVIGEIVKSSVSADAMVQQILGVMAVTGKLLEAFDNEP